MNPFIYPKNRHKRQLEPGPFGTYQRYKPFLKKEFSSQCVYCRLPDGLKGYDSFGVDHYLPKSEFPELATVYSNLFYACNVCNRRKSDFWPTLRDKRERRIIVNPCDHIMFEHLKYNSVSVESRTPEGSWTKDTLDLNERRTVEYRELLSGIINGYVKEKAKIVLAIKQIEAKIASDPGRSKELINEKNIAEEMMGRIEARLNRILAEPEVIS